MVKFTKILVVSILGLAMALGLALAQTDTATVDASVSSSTQVDITPNSFTFSNVNVGTFSPSSKSAVIENIGSTNVTKLSIDVNNANPYGAGSGNLGVVDAGAYLLASTDDTTYAYMESKLGTIEAMPSYVINSANTGTKGRFRFTEYEYFWEVVTGNVTGGGATPACGNGTLRYFNTTGNVHNRTQQGGSDLTTLSGVTLTLNAPVGASSTTSDGWGFSDVTFNMPQNHPYLYNTGYCFAVRQDCTQAVLFKWNNNVGLGPAGALAYDNASLCTQDSFIINDGSNGGVFKPGQLQNIYFNAAIPFGVANGSLLQSTITVRATD